MPCTIGVVMLYVLLIGPVQYLHDKSIIGGQTLHAIERFYVPLVYLAERSPSFQEWISDYTYYWDSLP
jgi:hypothetical protein